MLGINKVSATFVVDEEDEFADDFERDSSIIELAAAAGLFPFPEELVIIAAADDDEGGLCFFSAVWLVLLFIIDSTESFKYLCKIDFLNWAESRFSASVERSELQSVKNVRSNKMIVNYCICAGM